MPAICLVSCLIIMYLSFPSWFPITYIETLFIFLVSGVQRFWWLDTCVYFTFLSVFFILSFPRSVGTLSSYIPLHQFLLQLCLSVSLIIGFYNFSFHSFMCVCMCNVFMVCVCAHIYAGPCACVCIYLEARGWCVFLCLSLPYTWRQVFHFNLKLTVTAVFAC